MALEEMTQDEQDYASAFDEDMQPSEVGGMDPEASGSAPGESGGGDGADVAVAAATTPEGEAGADGNAGEQSAGEADIAAAAEPAPPAIDPEKEAQRLRSWEGRLKAMERELAAKAAAAGKPVEEVASEAIEDVSEETPNPELGMAADEVAEKVESGEMSVEDAMTQLADDFGPDFVKMIEMIASSKAREAGEKAAGEKFGELNKTVDEIIGDIVDGKAKAHFTAIASAHPDFNDIGKSAEFSSFLEALPPEQKVEAERIRQGGSAEEIIELLTFYKSASKGTGAPQADTQPEPEDPALDAAEGVRSSGMSLPEEPKVADDDFAGAWEQF